MNVAKLSLALFLAPASACLLSLTGCGSEPSSPVEQKQLVNDSAATIKDLEIADPSLTDKLNSAAGYAIFPNVGKGALGIEVASGNGDVYVQGGKFIGQSHLGMVGGGLAIGGETYAELILFETPAALQDFEDNKVKFDASASATALQSGAAAMAKFDKGVLVFTKTKGGLIASAVIGGQQFTFKAANPMPATQP